MDRKNEENSATGGNDEVSLLRQRIVQLEHRLDDLERRKTDDRIQALFELLVDFDPELEAFYRLRNHEASMIFSVHENPEADWETERKKYRSAQRQRLFRGKWQRIADRVKW